MRIETNKAIVLRYLVESHNPPYNLNVVDELCDPAFAEANKRWLLHEQAAFPDIHLLVDKLFAEGDQVFVQWTVRGTHRAEFWTPAGTVPPTGKTLCLGAMVVYRLEDGKIIEGWSTIDWLKGLMDLGAEVRLPGPPKTG